MKQVNMQEESSFCINQKLRTKEAKEVPNITNKQVEKGS
jgi:hypothetical protein